MTPLPAELLESVAAAAVREGLADALFTRVATPIGRLLVVQGADGILRVGFEALIGTLPGGAQAALRLRFVEDLDYDGIARRLGCSVAAARQRVSTAIRTLRAQELPA